MQYIGKCKREESEFVGLADMKNNYQLIARSKKRESLRIIYDDCGGSLQIVSKAMIIAKSSAENVDENDGSRYKLVKENEKTAQSTTELNLEHLCSFDQVGEYHQRLLQGFNDRRGNLVFIEIQELKEYR